MKINYTHTHNVLSYPSLHMATRVHVSIGCRLNIPDSTNLLALYRQRGHSLDMVQKNQRLRVEDEGCSNVHNTPACTFMDDAFLPAVQKFRVVIRGCLLLSKTKVQGFP